MSTLKKLQEKLDDKTLNPNDFNEEQRSIIDGLIDTGRLKGPKMDELSEMRKSATDQIVSEREFLQDPLKASTGVGLSTYELTGDIIGSIFPYVFIR